MVSKVDVWDGEMVMVLYFVVCSCFVSIVEVLIKVGLFLIDVFNSYGGLFFFWVVNYDCLEVVWVLIRVGVDIYMVDVNGRLVILFCIYNLNMIKVFVDEERE